MKKQLLTLLTVTLVTLVSCKKSNPVPQTQTEDIKFTEIVATITPYKLGQPSSSDKFVWSRKKFDADGNLTFSSERKGSYIFDASSSYENITTFKYENGKMVEKKADIWRYTYAYSGNDTLEVKEYYGGQLYQTLKYEYQNNKLSAVKCYEGNGKISGIRAYNYNGKGQLVTIDIYGAVFDGGDQLKFTYNDRGHLTSETQFLAEPGKFFVIRVLAYKYDSSGRIKEYTYNWDESSFLKRMISYDSKGKIEKEDIFLGDNMEGEFKQTGVISYAYSSCCFSSGTSMN